jgi:hypothetical protein
MAGVRVTATDYSAKINRLVGLLLENRPPVKAFLKVILSSPAEGRLAFSGAK